MYECVTEKELDLFHAPARIIVAGYSNSGKSHLVSKLIQKYHHKFDVILMCGIGKHELQNNPIIKEKLILSETISCPLAELHPPNKTLLYVLDDCFLQAGTNSAVLDAFTKGRHHGISVIFITQNVFFPGKYSRSINLNCSHYILLKQRDLNQVECLARQTFGTEKAKAVRNIFSKQAEGKTHPYMLIDLSVTAREAIQFRSNIAGEEPYEIVYQW